MPTSPRSAAILDYSHQHWQADVLPLLQSFARIPDLSPAFEPGWELAGHIEEAAGLVAEWASARAIPGAVVEIVRIPGLTPTVVVDVPATDAGASGTVLIYGHYDKQPPFEGWAPGRGAWSPVIEGDLLYARGVADDGYALPTALLAIEAVEAAGGQHGRCLILAEGSEESGSPHLPAVLEHLADRIGTPDVVIALDSGSPTYDSLWITTSLRGAITGTLTVSVLTEGVHSGSAGAVVPSSFRILRLLLDRIEDAETGDLLLPELVVEPPPGAFSAAVAMADVLVVSGLDAPPFPTVDGLELQGADIAEREIRTGWLGSLAVVGADGLPPSAEAGNVLRPSTSLRLTIRIPPTCDPDAAALAVERALTSDPPYGASVEWTGEAVGGWAASPFAPWLVKVLDDASRACFGQPSGRFGEGGTIPFMGWLATQFPEAQLLAAGVLGPGSNAHGPNECLHLPTAERISAGLAMVLDAHGGHRPAT